MKVHTVFDPILHLLYSTNNRDFMFFLYITRTLTSHLWIFEEYVRII